MSGDVAWVVIVLSAGWGLWLFIFALPAVLHEMKRKRRERSERNCSPVPPPAGTKWEFTNEWLRLRPDVPTPESYVERVYYLSQLRKASEAILRSYEADRFHLDKQEQIRVRVEAANKAAGVGK